MDLELKIINKTDNTKNSKLLSPHHFVLVCLDSNSLAVFEFNIIRKYTLGRMEADLIIGLFIYEIRVVTREMMIESEVGEGGQVRAGTSIHFI